MNRTRARRASLVAVIALALSLAACGTGNFIDQDTLESQVVEGAPPGLGVESASCPEEVNSDQGTEFTCTITTSGGEAEATGTVLSEDDDQVRFDIDYASAGGTTGPTGAEGQTD